MRGSVCAVLVLLLAAVSGLPVFYHSHSLCPGCGHLGFGSRTDSIPGSKRLAAKPLHAHRFEETLCWAVKLQTKGEHHGRALAEQLRVTFLGFVGDFDDVLLVCHTENDPEVYRGTRNLQDHLGSHRHLNRRNNTHFTFVKDQMENQLDGHLAVEWYNREVVRSRQKRSVYFSDPFFPRQWHLRNLRMAGMDINVTGVWAGGITGKGVTVAVVDDGVEWTNPDLRENYNSEGSWDLNDEDPDPMPSAAKDSNHHGTRCAGEIAAVANSVCGVGVAHGAKFSGLRVLDGPMTDSLEASAFNKRLQVNDIFSCSWGPDDDGKTVDGPHIMAAKAMKYGVDYGRHGFGSIFVVASGNGGRHHDNCNYDGYANSIYTVTIGAVDEQGRMPFYAEECASMLGVTFSSGTSTDRDIVTTDWTKRNGAGCTERHTGTSAAAPLAAGMIALMLEARSCLTWRDVQFLIALTAVKVDVDRAHWQKNGAGLEHSHKHGFGLLKAWRMVNAAKVWEPVPWMTSFLHSEPNVNREIPADSSKMLLVSHTVTEAEIDGYDLGILEQVQVTVTLTHPQRGLLDIRLTSPSGIESVIGAPRPLDNSSAGFTEWSFTTVRCWGEKPTGLWTLTIHDTGTKPHRAGILKSWGLHLFGCPMAPTEFQRRRRVIEEAMSGQYLSSNVQLPCPPPPITASPNMPVSEKTLKILCLSGAFCVIMALYETLEYMFCYNDEKKEHRQTLKQEARERKTGATPTASSSHNSQDNPDASETARLLQEEEIPMDTFPSSTQESHHGEITLFEQGQLREGSRETTPTDGVWESSQERRFLEDNLFLHSGMTRTDQHAPSRRNEGNHSRLLTGSVSGRESHSSISQNRSVLTDRGLSSPHAQGDLDSLSSTCASRFHDNTVPSRASRSLGTCRVDRNSLCDGANGAVCERPSDDSDEGEDDETARLIGRSQGPIDAVLPSHHGR